MININKAGVFLILGCGISGSSTAKFLKRMGHEVIIYDDAAELAKIGDIDLKSITAIVKSPGIPFMPHNQHFLLKQASVINVPIISNYDVFALYNQKSKVIVVTGTNGKSTTTALINHILQCAGINSQMGGNIGIPYGDLSLDADICVFEMSSYELAVSRYMKFDICCLLNIRPDHLELHGSFKNYISAKHSALDHSKVKVISYEDFVTMEKYKTGSVTVSVTGNKRADICVDDGILEDNDKAACDISTLSNLKGKHNYQNAAFAYAACKALGIPKELIVSGMNSFKALPHRMKVTRRIGDILFINDSKATNPDSAVGALDAYAGHKILWLVGGRSKKTSIDVVMPCIGNVVRIYLFGESANEFEEAFADVKKTVKCSTLDNAVNIAYRDAVSENGPTIVLLSPMCSSFDQFKNFEERGNAFCKLVANLT